MQASRIYGTGTHCLKEVVANLDLDHQPALVETGRAWAWTQFETLMDRYINVVGAGHGGSVTAGTWMHGSRVAEWDSDVSNDQLEALVMCLAAVDADVDGACEAVAGGAEWWVVPSPLAHFGKWDPRRGSYVLDQMMLTCVESATDATASGLGVFKFEDQDQSRHTMAIGTPPHNSGEYYPTYTVGGLATGVAKLCKSPLYFHSLSIEGLLTYHSGGGGSLGGIPG